MLAQFLFRNILFALTFTYRILFGAKATIM